MFSKKLSLGLAKCMVAVLAIGMFRATVTAEEPDTAPNPPNAPRPPVWRSNPLGQVRLDPNPANGLLPTDRSEALFSFSKGVPAGSVTRHTPMEFHWEPSNLAYQPLYFDDVPLERYGQSIWPTAQPVLSGIHFFGMFPIMPYKMGIDRTHDPIYTLGYHRVGTNAPPLRQRLPWEWDAALIQAGASVGMIFALP